jgi:hypothetical protein
MGEKKEDGTGKLCDVLYGRDRPDRYLGGSESPMLYDAVEEIESLRALNKEAFDALVALIKDYKKCVTIFCMNPDVLEDAEKAVRAHH